MMNPSLQQQVFNDFGQLVAAVRECCAGRQPWLVVIDGFTGSGKSDLGRRLSAALGAIHVEVDDFLNEHQLVYVAHIRYSELSERLSEIRVKSECVVLEGVCAQEILNGIGLASTTTIYVKRLVSGTWRPERILREAGSLEEAMVFEEAETQLASELNIEEFTYHFQFKPHERSAFVYSWNS